MLLFKTIISHSAINNQLISNQLIVQADSFTAAGSSTRVMLISEAIFLHSSAHLRHAIAQALHAASVRRSHSTAQMSQISAHNAQKRKDCSSPRFRKVAVRRQRSAQEMLNSSVFESEFTFCESEQVTAQCSQLAAHCWHAMMHAQVNSSFILLSN